MKKSLPTAKRRIEELRILWSWIKAQVYGDVSKDVPKHILFLAKKYGCLYNGFVYKGGIKIPKIKIPKIGDYITLKPAYSSWSKSKSAAIRFFGVFGRMVGEGNLLLRGEAKNGIDILKCVRVIETSGVVIWPPNRIKIEKEIVAKITKAKVLDIYIYTGDEG